MAKLTGYSANGATALPRLITRRHSIHLALARISHRLTGKAHDRPAITSLRLLAVLTVLFKYASARQAARALY